MYKIYSDAIKYKDEQVNRIVKHRNFLKKIFFFLNMLSLLGALAASTLTALMVSKLLYPSYPFWFFLSTAGISALITLVSSLLSFFVIKDNIEKLSRRLIKIEAEEVLYNNKQLKKYQDKNRDFSYYLSIASIVGVNIAREEVNHGKQVKSNR